MREIKFRAWDKIQNKMVDMPYLEHHKSGFRLLDQGDDCEFDFMQFTGIKDKNGNEIYEGDIILGEEKELETGAYYEVKDVVTWNALGFWEYANTDGEVIGNIYENPELLT